MKTCTFIGHKNTPLKIETILESTLRDLILKENVTRFYVGTHGAFDKMVQRVLEKLSKEYLYIEYLIVLAYLPRNKQGNMEYLKTIYPDGLENVPPKYAINERNKWMIKKCDILVCYVANSFSNSYIFKEFAEKKSKQVVNLFEKE